MKYIKKLPIKFDIKELRSALDHLNKIGDWHPNHGQMGLVHTPYEFKGKNNWHEGTGSLKFAWGDDAFDDNDKLKLLDRTLTEEDFTEFNVEAKDTYFYHIYQELSKFYTFGRVRLMMVPPRRCLSWHVDIEERVHVPIISNPGNFLVINDEVYHLDDDGSCYIADVIHAHTAFNGGVTVRYNLLMNVLDYKENAVSNYKNKQEVELTKKCYRIHNEELQTMQH